jgi:hypothetical protein
MRFREGERDDRNKNIKERKKRIEKEKERD